METFGQVLRRKRLSIKMRTKDFAPLCGLKDNYICQIEKQGRLCTSEKLKAILSLFEEADKIELARAFFKQKASFSENDYSAWMALSNNPKIFLNPTKGD